MVEGAVGIEQHLLALALNLFKGGDEPLKAASRQGKKQTIARPGRTRIHIC